MNDRFTYLTTNDGARLAYRIEGRDDAPLLVLSNSIGTTLQMWDPQMPAFARRFRVLRYDARGHGASSVPAGRYSLARLGQDVVELLDALDVERAHFIGLSLGGIVGQWLGVHAAQRIDRLVLANTAPWLGPAERWDGPIDTALQGDDMSETAEAFLRNWFPPRMLDSRDPVVDRFRAMLLATNRHGLVGSWAAVQESDLREDIAQITRPTLVIAGEHDTVTAASFSEQMARTIPGAQLRVFPAVHLSNVECADAFDDAVIAFLEAAR